MPRFKVETSSVVHITQSHIVEADSLEQAEALSREQCRSALDLAELPYEKDVGEIEDITVLANQYLRAEPVPDDTKLPHEKWWQTYFIAMLPHNTEGAVFTSLLDGEQCAGIRPFNGFRSSLADYIREEQLDGDDQELQIFRIILCDKNRIHPAPETLNSGDE